MAYSNIHKYYYSFSIPIFLVVVVSFIADFVGLLIFVFCINVFIWLESDCCYTCSDCLSRRASSISCLSCIIFSFLLCYSAKGSRRETTGLENYIPGLLGIPETRRWMKK